MSQIPTRLRFEVFKRDGFVCQYCGRHPPDVILHCDHITAVANGGPTTLENLLTACQDCNLGKGAVPLASIPASIAEQSAILAEREAQVQGYHALLEEQRQRVEAEVWRVVHIFDPLASSCSHGTFKSIKRFIKDLGLYVVLDAAEMAIGATHAKDPFLYFCGICWNWIKDGVPGQRPGGCAT
jgi:hypothetical protein